jgi:hypothetical protein
MGIAVDHKNLLYFIRSVAARGLEEPRDQLLKVRELILIHEFD